MTLQDHFISNVQLEREWAYDRNPEKPEELPPHSRKKVWWRCGKGHEWQAALDSRVYAGRNCPYCSNQMIIPGHNDVATVAPEMLKLWHPVLNRDLSPSDVSPGSKRQVWWQCQRGHAWRAPLYSIKAGTSCPYCSGRKAIPGETDLVTTHSDILKLWSGRNTVSPTEITAGSHRRIWWVCEKGHEWEAMVSSVAIDGCRCPYCAGKRAIPGETDMATMRPDMLVQWDYEKNTTVSPDEILPSSHDKVWWKCELGHSWQAVVFSRTKEKGTGCPYCTGRKVLPGFNDLATRKPKLAQEWHPLLNGELRPEAVTPGCNKKVWWRCAEGHVWQAAVYSRTRQKGTGCPVCAGLVKSRKK